MGRCVVQTGLGRFAECVLALSLVAGLKVRGVAAYIKSRSKQNRPSHPIR